MRLRFLLIQLLPLVAGCGNSATSGSPADAGGAPPSSWTEAADAFATQASGSYSLIFFGEPPGERGLHVALLLGAGSESCQRYAAHFRSPNPPPDELWVLDAWLTATEPGDYEVTLHPNFPSERPLARSGVALWKNGREAFRNTALRGTVTLEAAATDTASWDSEQELRALIDLELPLHPIQSEGCEFMGGDDVATNAKCHCVDESGDAFTCEHELGDPDCCLDKTTEFRPLRFELSAQPCAALCDATSLIYQRNCSELE